MAMGRQRLEKQNRPLAAGFELVYNPKINVLCERLVS